MLDFAQRPSSAQKQDFSQRPSSARRPNSARRPEFAQRPSSTRRSNSAQRPPDSAQRPSSARRPNSAQRSNSARNSEQRPSSARRASSCRILGDSNQRITVPLPRSLHELQKRAEQHFGHSGELKMYHHGTVPILRPEQLSRIRNGDVVVVTWNNRRLNDRELADLLKTTSQAFYVEHPLPKRKPQAAAQELPPSLPLDGITEHKAEYVKHPLSARERAMRPLHSWSPRTEPTGKTTYEDKYLWPALQSVVKRSPMVDEFNWDTGPFQGHTQYMQDYVMHPIKPRGEMPSRPRPRSASHVPFEGKSTYAAEYTEKPLATRTSCHAKISKREWMPFEGASHYQTNYVAPEMERTMIHLEPELTSS